MTKHAAFGISFCVPFLGARDAAHPKALKRLSKPPLAEKEKDKDDEQSEVGAPENRWAWVFVCGPLLSEASFSRQLYGALI